jgi:hypothetical protein
VSRDFFPVIPAQAGIQKIVNANMYTIKESNPAYLEFSGSRIKYGMTTVEYGMVRKNAGKTVKE